MAGCPLCILGLTEDEHTQENWNRAATDPEWSAIIYARWAEQPGVLINCDDCDENISRDISIFKTKDGRLLCPGCGGQEPPENIERTV